jgi:uncharacterized protein YqjF (DUF2071 family)
MHDSLAETAHRPYPVPGGQWVMEQSWHDLLFAHWSYPAAVIRAAVPAQLPIDTFDGRAWAGVVPFQVRGLRARWLPAIRGLSDFPELNVRTYVTIGGKPGVYFFSLDAGSAWAVQGARIAFHLNYYRALMSMTRGPRGITYLSRRTDRRGRPADFSARYRANGKGVRAQPGSLEYFLIERYCLYAVSPSGRINRMDIHHRPWLLQPAEAEIDADMLLAAAQIPAPGERPLLHFSALQEMIGWLPERVPSPGTSTQ